MLFCKRLSERPCWILFNSPLLEQAGLSTCFIARVTPLCVIEQEENLMHGVDVTHSRFFDQPKVQEAVAFAAAAHKGQQRKTKEPYVTHCIETACIVEEVLDLAEDSEYNSR